MNKQVAWKGEKEKTVYRNRHLGLKIGVASFAVLFLVILGVIYYIVTTYTVNTVYVEGNIHYTDEEIAERIIISYSSITEGTKYFILIYGW